MKRGQSAIEFVILASVMLFGVAVLVISAERMLVDIERDADARTIGSISRAVNAELSLAGTQPAGYQRSFSLPYSLGGVDYGVQIIDEAWPLHDAVRVTYKGYSYLQFVDYNLSGTVAPGPNTLRRTDTAIIFN